MPKEDLIIDLDKELISMFDKEEMFAFFDIQIITPSDKIVSGLCKVTKPKAGEARSSYFSLLFIFDIPDNETWREVDKLMNDIQWEDSFESYSERIDYVLPMLSRSLSTGNYFKEVCIYLAGINDLQDNIFLIKYIMSYRLSHFKTGDLTFWDDLK